MDTSYMLEIKKAMVENSKELSLSYSEFENDKLPKQFFELTQLECLWLSYTNLKTLPNEFSCFTELKYLELIGVNWIEFPEVICKLKKLEVLVFGGVDDSGPGADYYLGVGVYRFQHANIQYLPAEIQELNQLRILDLSICSLKHLPLEIEKLSNLETLKVYDNSIESLPTGLSKLKNLRLLDLRNNPCCTLIPREVLSLSEDSGLFSATGAYTDHSIQSDLNSYLKYPEISKDHGLLDLLSYLEEIEKGHVTIASAKILVLGDALVGKTTLVNYLITGYFTSYSNRNYEKEHRTHGIIISNWMVNNIRVNLWDFGGQEIYHGIHRLFISSDVLYIIMVDAETLEEDEKRLSYWLDFIDNSDKSTRTIIVQNKIDIQQTDIKDLDVLQKKYRFERTIHYISLSKFIGVKIFEKAIEESVKSITVKDRLPGSWNRIEIKLIEMKNSGKRYITLDEYLFLCQSESLDQLAAGAIAEYLGNKGTIFFKKHLFDQLIILDQQWVINKIYLLLKSENLTYINKGVISKDDIIKICNANTGTELDLFLKFMLSCEICFRESSKKEELYVIPHLLPFKDAFIENIWSSIDNIYFQIKHRFLHDRIIERFIIRVAHMANKHYWKDCTIIRDEYSDATAIIDSCTKEKSIKIRIKGINKISFMFHLREQFKQLREYELAEEYVSIDGKEFVDLNLLEEKYKKRHKKIESLSRQELNVETFSFLFQRENTPFLPIKIFISYSHKDRLYKERFITGLALLRNEGKIDEWHDAKLLAGDKFDNEIMKNINDANVICLLISPDFMASSYCYSREMGRAFERYENGEAIIIPIILRETPGLDNTKIGGINAIPVNGKPIKKWLDKDAAWASVITEIGRLVGDVGFGLEK